MQDCGVNLMNFGPLGVARAMGPALLADRSQDGEGRAASSERRPGRPQRASGAMDGQPRAPISGPRFEACSGGGCRNPRLAVLVVRLGD